MEFLRSAKLLSLLTLTSRILGLCRDMITTAVLSALHSDALYLAWTIPNLFRNLFGEGALSSAFIPAFSRVLEMEGRARAFRLARRVITCMALFLLALVAMLIGLSLVLPESWLLPFFQGNKEKLDGTMSLMRILLPYLAVVCVIAQFQGVLNSLKHFFIPALSPVLLNVAWILAAVAAGWLVFEEDTARTHLIAAGIMAGGLVQIAVFVVGLRRHQFPLRPAFGFRNPDFLKVLGTSLPMVIGTSAVQLNILVDRGVASTFLPDGGVTHLFVGNRLMQFPFALIGIALTTAVFPLLSSLSARGDREGMKKNLSGALRINFFLSVPAALGLCLLAHPIISLFFGREQFTPDRVEDTARALLGYVMGIPFLCSVMLLTRTFYALGEWRRPVTVSCILVSVNIVLDLLLVEPFAEAGISAATSISAILQSAILVCLLRRMMGPLGGKSIFKGLAGTVLSTAFLLFAVAGLLWIMGPEKTDDTLWTKTARVFIPLFGGLAVYLAVARKICPFEWSGIVEALKRRRTRSAQKIEGGRES